MNNLAVLILGGGSGTRFWPFKTDKLIFPMMGSPFIHGILPQRIPKEASKVVIVTNELNNSQFQSIVTDKIIKTVIQKQSFGMADAILAAESEIRDHAVLILIADDYYDASLTDEVMQLSQTSSSFGIIPGWKTASYFPGGYMVLDHERITDIIEKPTAGEEPSDYVAISGHFIREANTLIDRMKSLTSDTDDIYEKALSSLMKEQEFIIKRYDKQFFSIKYPWNMLDYMELQLNHIEDHRGENVTIKDHVVIEGTVHIGNNVKIMEFSKIVGPCFIGDNTIIGNMNVIRHSVIGKNCVTGYSTDITRSYIGDDCWFHTNYIGDSVLEGNCSMGSGAVLANLRLDEGVIHSIVKEHKVSTNRNKLGAMIGKNVRIGVNTSLMPGVKIGRDSFIGAGITIEKDIPDHSFVRGEHKLHIDNNSVDILPDRSTFKNSI